MLPGPGWPAFTASWFAPLPAVPACCIADLLDHANINSHVHAQLAPMLYITILVFAVPAHCQVSILQKVMSDQQLLQQLIVTWCCRRWLLLKAVRLYCLTKAPLRLTLPCQAQKFRLSSMRCSSLSKIMLCMICIMTLVLSCCQACHCLKSSKYSHIRRMLYESEIIHTYSMP